jgi:glycosyltransferase involved in cell wall biosynthesis
LQRQSRYGGSPAQVAGSFDHIGRRRRQSKSNLGVAEKPATVPCNVQHRRRIELAEKLREQRESLERSVNAAAKKGLPLTELEAQLLVEASDVRISEVEHALRDAGPIARMLHRLIDPMQRFASRVRGLGRPRIGRLVHYPARTLELPASYREATPPGQTPAISIVTPSFQHARFIATTIQSVLTQEYPALEYIVQDGGSTDETVEILESFSDGITHWTSEPDDGHADALNRGFRQTSGEIMGWLNSDDLLLPGSLACIARFFVEHPEVDVVYGNRLMIDESGGEIGAWILPAHDDLALTLADFIPQETLFWRRRIWDASGGCLDDSFTYALDWDLLLRFRAAGARMVHLPRFIGAFRVHDGQRTSTAYTAGLEEMARLRERAYGRPVSTTEVSQRLRPYLRRHVRAHVRYRLAERVGGARIPVDFGYRPALKAEALRPPLTVDEPSLAFDDVSSPRI